MTDVTLRDVRESDLELFYEHQLDPEAVAMAAFPSRDRDAFTAHWSRILADDACITRTIEADGEVTGNIGSWVQDGHRELGYWIGRAHWGRGIATLAVAALVRELEARPLYAYVAPHNVASARVLEKCGFVRAGEEGELLVFRLG